MDSFLSLVISSSQIKMTRLPALFLSRTSTDCVMQRSPGTSPLYTPTSIFRSSGPYFQEFLRSVSTLLNTWAMVRSEKKKGDLVAQLPAAVSIQFSCNCDPTAHHLQTGIGNNMHIKLSQHWFTFPAFFFSPPFKLGHCKADTSVEKKGGSDAREATSPAPAHLNKHFIIHHRAMTDESCWRILENVSNLIYMLMVCWEWSASVSDFLILLSLRPAPAEWEWRRQVTALQQFMI